MKFSIIIPTFNRCHILWKALLSVKSQAYSDFEVIVIDDGSTDMTKSLVKEFEVDSRFKYFYKKNGGASSARNLGLEHSTGDMITYLDSDEELYSNYLEIANHFFSKNEDKIFGTSNFNFVLEKYDENFNKTERINFSSSQKMNVKFEDILNWKVKTCGTGIFHKANIDVSWDESITLLEDLDFLISIGEKYPNGFLHISYALFEYRQRYMTDGQCSLANYEDFSNAFKGIYDKHNGVKFNLEKEVYLGRYDKYAKLAQQFSDREVPAMNEYIFDQAKK